ncbi:hypothetical protein Goklo_016981 [Gossypium klotzschianum]|uniref:poly(A)-specific ribonuclease n=1 Tax=Gossypium klotzschianum TaxID=34286 RepID=A0A7J8UG02_9ROSI|nr:hypothetical protein [Gossypium klotzschianum]
MSISCNKSIVVRRVFAEDLDNTEFPGTIFKPSKQVVFEDNPVINYHYMKSNVDALQIIQLGLSLSDAQGNLPDFDSPFCYVWEFNFKDFNINRDHYASTSIELLKRQGIDFEKNKEKGIDSRDFAKKCLLKVHCLWIFTHSCINWLFSLATMFSTSNTHSNY